MKIKEIQIRNFRQYKNVDLLFPDTDSYDLNYVLAENGIGKTTLLNSITWCLYGKELHITDGLRDKTLPLLTLKTLREMYIGEETDTSVTIVLEDSEGEVSFERSHIYRKTEEGLAYEKAKGQKVIVSKNSSVPVILTTEEEFKVEVNKRLPYKIQQFFFFDGEQLDTYLANTTGENVEQTVLQISQIDLLVTMEKNLDIVGTEMRRIAAKTNSQTAEINDQYEKKETEVIYLTEKIRKEEKDQSKAKNELQAIQSELGDDPDISVLEEERDSLDKKLTLLKNEQKENTYSIKYFLNKYLTLLTALPRLKSMYDLIQEKEKNKQLPPQYDKVELQEMLSEHHCHVCNRDLDTDATIYIAELIKRYELGHETGTLLSRMFGILQMQIQEAGKYEQKRDELYRSKERIENDIASTSKRLREIDGIIDKYTNKEHIIALYAKRSEVEKFIDDNNKQIVRDGVELERIEKERDELKKQLNIAMKTDKANAKLRREHEMAERAKAYVTRIIADIKGNIRKQISDEMSAKFFELMWKTKFQAVEITENYSASVKNEDGFECLGSCSAAERELLVLAFTLALHKESGFDGPLVIDTPISRISGDLRVAFAKVLRSVSESKQIILFVTEDEYSTNVRDVFEPYANKKFKFTLVEEDYVKVGDL